MLIVHLFVSYAHVNLCHFFSSSWCRGLTAASACGSSWTFLFTFLFNGSTGEWFGTTVGVRRGCLLLPIFFNIFLERIMCEALDNHEGSVSIGGRLNTNFRFADDIVVNPEEEEEAGVLVDRFDTTTRFVPPQGTKWRSAQTRQK